MPQHGVHPVLRGVSVAKGGIKVDEPCGAPAGPDAVVPLVRVLAPEIGGLAHGGGIFRRIEHVPFRAGKQAVKMADMAMALLHFFKRLPPFQHPPVGANGRLGNLFEELNGFDQSRRPYAQLSAGVNVIAEGLPAQKLVMRSPVGNVGKHVGACAVRRVKSGFRGDAGPGKVMPLVVLLKPGHDETRVGFQNGQGLLQVFPVSGEAVAVHQVGARPRPVHEAGPPFRVIS